MNNFYLPVAIEVSGLLIRTGIVLTGIIGTFDIIGGTESKTSVEISLLFFFLIRGNKKCAGAFGDNLFGGMAFNLSEHVFCQIYGFS